jgi:aminodeoxyfutalosine deaminase
MPQRAQPRALRARRVVTMTPGAGIVEDAALILAGRRILDVGPRRSVLAGFDGPVEDLGEVVVVPGLINAHVHLELSHLRGRAPRGVGFAAWAGWLIGQARARLTEADLAAAVAEMTACGTGAVIDIGDRDRPAVALALEAAGLAGLICHEYFGFRPAPPEDLPQALAAVEKRLTLGRVAVSGHALYSTSPENLRRARDVCRRRGAPFSLHLAEHRGEVELLATGTGDFAALLKQRVLPREYRPPGRTPVAAAKALGLLGPDVLAVHAVWLDRDDMDLLAVSGTAVCLCPRSNARIGVGRADAPGLLAAGVPLCLGTDSLASNDDLNLWNEVRALLADHPDFPPAAVLPALTTTPARLLGRAATLGVLAPGARCGYAVAPADLESFLFG